MRYVAFLRNVNQGQSGHPSTDDIRGAFADAGCPDAMLFQSNGTVVFAADDLPRVLETVTASIAARSGRERDVFAIPFDDLAEAVDAHAGVMTPRRFEFTLHGGGRIDPENPQAIREAAARRCAIVDAGDDWALLRNERDGDGNATPVIERLTGGPASSRGLPTLVRLVDRFADRG
ncbi:DUF1697 domain-containing protein [Microbacterium sp. Marseille-Q6965]|uniref:DUF1697 domain-containing protein n=1 Tax=Microbacterium sp. Marseille-Q6965 TaxID=2965072 RepID=UPI0021B730B0|nr:DUF1697 domain-containing protein [Microbacterium sp. Marseille-Q6965]